MADKVGVGISPNTTDHDKFEKSYAECSSSMPQNGKIAVVMGYSKLASNGAMQQGSVVHMRPELRIERPGQPRGPATVDMAFPSQWASFNMDLSGIDEGAADLLFGLVRGFRATVALETGTHRGRSTKAIASAMVKSGQGHLWTVDAVDYDLFGSGALTSQEANRVTQVLGMTPEIFNSEPLASLSGIDFAFLDGAHTCKGLQADLDYVYARCAEECLIVVDNARDYGWPEIEEMFKTFCLYPHINIGTLCGMEIIVVRKAVDL